MTAIAVCHGYLPWQPLQSTTDIFYDSHCSLPLLSSMTAIAVYHGYLLWQSLQSITAILHAAIAIYHCFLLWQPLQSITAIVYDSRCNLSRLSSITAIAIYHGYLLWQILQSITAIFSKTITAGFYRPLQRRMSTSNAGSSTYKMTYSKHLGKQFLHSKRKNCKSCRNQRKNFLCNSKNLSWIINNLQQVSRIVWKYANLFSCQLDKNTRAVTLKKWKIVFFNTAVKKKCYFKISSYIKS